MSTTELPALNAILNSMSAIMLTVGYVFIRKGEHTAHRNCMISAFVTSTLFLVSYLIYHYNHGSTPFRGQGMVRILYFSILLTHTILAATIVPLVFVTLSRALRDRFDKHRSIARWTLPLWLYVSVTGVVVYLMLYRLYPAR
jgi:putative membrane protein